MHAVYPAQYIPNIQAQTNRQRSPRTVSAACFEYLPVLSSHALVDPSTVALQHLSESDGVKRCTLTFDLHCMRESASDILTQSKVIVKNGKVKYTAASHPFSALSSSRSIASVGKNPCRFQLHVPTSQRTTAWPLRLSWRRLFGYEKEKLLHLVIQVTPLNRKGDDDGEATLHIHIVIPFTALYDLPGRHAETPRVRQILQLSNGLYEIEEMFGCGPQSRHGTLPRDPLCAICLAQTRNAVFLPCKHFCCCAPCAKLLYERSRDTQQEPDLLCPICRQAASLIGVYS